MGWLKTISLSLPSVKRVSFHSRFLYFKIGINASCLEYLEHNGRFFDDYSANFSCSLVEARILGGCVFGLLDAISGVQNLTLIGGAMWNLRSGIEHHDLPIFHDLKKLELYVGNPVMWDVIPNSLECSPKLEVLNFPHGLVQRGANISYFGWHRPDKVVECLKMNLKKVEIFNFMGLPCEMFVVAYLLE